MFGFAILFVIQSIVNWDRDSGCVRVVSRWTKLNTNGDAINVALKGIVPCHSPPVSYAESSILRPRVY
jgi:hypothetical protein